MVENCALISCRITGGRVDKVLRKVAGRGSQRDRAFETPHCQAGAPAREGSRGHYREALWSNRCPDD